MSAMTRSSSRDTVVRGIVVQIGLGAVLLAVATTWLGWWEPVLVEEPRSGPRGRWPFRSCSPLSRSV